MNIIAEPYLYRTVQVYQTEDTDDHSTERLIESVSGNPARAAHIRTLRVPFFWKFASVLPLFANLRRLHYSTLPNGGLDDPAYYPALASLTNLTHLNWWRPVEDPEVFVNFLEAQHSLQHLTLVAYDVVGIHKSKVLTIPSTSLMSLQHLTTLDELAVPFLVGRSIRHLQLYAYNPGLFYLRGKSLPSVKTFSCPLSNISWVNHFPELQFLEIREFPMQVTDLARHLHSITNNHLTFVSLVTSNSYLAYLETHQFSKPVDANAYKTMFPRISKLDTVFYDTLQPQQPGHCYRYQYERSSTTPISPLRLADVPAPSPWNLWWESRGIDDDVGLGIEPLAEGQS